MADLTFDHDNLAIDRLAIEYVDQGVFDYEYEYE
jgi:hypothetical protein